MGVIKKAGGIGDNFDVELGKKDSALLASGIVWDGAGNVTYPDDLSDALLAKLKQVVNAHSKATAKKYTRGSFRRVLSWFTNAEMNKLMTAVRERNDIAERFFKLMARDSVNVSKGDYRRFIKRCARTTVNNASVTAVISSGRKTELLAKRFDKPAESDPNDADD